MEGHAQLQDAAISLPCFLGLGVWVCPWLLYGACQCTCVVVCELISWALAWVATGACVHLITPTPPPATPLLFLLPQDFGFVQRFELVQVVHELFPAVCLSPRRLALELGAVREHPFRLRGPQRTSLALPLLKLRRVHLGAFGEQNNSA